MVYFRVVDARHRSSCMMRMYLRSLCEDMYNFLWGDHRSYLTIDHKYYSLDGEI